MMQSCLVILSLVVSTICRCVYTQPESGLPYLYDGEAFPQNYTGQVCKDYIGEDVCCNEYNAKLSADNFKQLDGVFSSLSGGCDICLINLKRFWCEYACSPRQS